MSEVDEGEKDERCRSGVESEWTVNGHRCFRPNGEQAGRTTNTRSRRLARRDRPGTLICPGLVAGLHLLPQRILKIASPRPQQPSEAAQC